MTAKIRTVGWVLLILAALLGLEFGLEPLIPDSSIRQLLMLAAIYVMVAVSLNVINGMAGQFSIGHAGFVGIGAYTSAIVASFFGLIVGLPSLRLRGDYLAIVTLGFAEIFRLVIASAQIDATHGVSKVIASLG